MVDTIPSGYELLALSFDGTTPRFAPNAKTEIIERKELAICFERQYPYIYQNIESVKQYCESTDVEYTFILRYMIERLEFTNRVCIGGLQFV